MEIPAPAWETCSKCSVWSLQSLPGSPLTTCAWICVVLSDLLSSGESVYTNPKSSAITEAGAEQLQALLRNSAPAPHYRQGSAVTPKGLLGSVSICASCTSRLPPILPGHLPYVREVPAGSCPALSSPSSTRTSSLCEKGSCRILSCSPVTSPGGNTEPSFGEGCGQAMPALGGGAAVRNGGGTVITLMAAKEGSFEEKISPLPYKKLKGIRHRKPSSKEDGVKGSLKKIPRLSRAQCSWMCQE